MLLFVDVRLLAVAIITVCSAQCMQAVADQENQEIIKICNGQ